MHSLRLHPSPAFAVVARIATVRIIGSILFILKDNGRNSIRWQPPIQVHVAFEPLEIWLIE